MFLLTGNGPDLATLQITAIRAAVKSGVEYVVKLSALGASSHSKSPIGRAHYEAEQALIGSGMRWAILRPHAFMQNLLDQTPAIVGEGRIFTEISTPFHLADRRHPGQEDPISSPVRNTSAPPRPTCIAAVSGGVSM